MTSCRSWVGGRVEGEGFRNEAPWRWSKHHDKDHHHRAPFDRGTVPGYGRTLHPQPSTRHPDDRPPPLRRRRRLVRQPLEPPEPPPRRARADRPPHRRAGGDGDPLGRPALGRALPLYDGARERPFQRPGPPDPADLDPPGGLPPRRRQLRHGRLAPARGGAALPRPAAGRGAARPSDLSHRLRLPEGDPEDPRARRETGAGIRDLPRWPPRDLLLLPVRPRRRVGGS